jgi:hypothetical protein
MKPIKDIRIYKSHIPNINGNPLPSESHLKTIPIVPPSAASP